jgi:hypothetical protein
MKDERNVLPRDVLLVEDSPDAALLVRQALAGTAFCVRELHFDEFCRRRESIVLFWCGVVALP